MIEWIESADEFTGTKGMDFEEFIDNVAYFYCN